MVAPSTRPRRGKVSASPGGATPLPEPGIDLGPLSESVGYGLQRAQLAVRSAVVDALARVDLSPGRFALLNVIDRNPGVSQVDAGVALGIQPTNVTPLLRDLERRGLIARRTSPSSRRTKMLELTSAGRRCLGRAQRLHREVEQRIFRSLGSRRRGLLLRWLEQLTTIQ